MPSLSTENKKRKETFLNAQVNVNISKLGIKMAGYWPSSSFCAYGWKQSLGPYTWKKRTRRISSQPTNLVNNQGHHLGLQHQLQLCMLHFPLMLQVKSPVIERIHPQSNKFAMGVENKATGDSKFNDSPE